MKAATAAEKYEVELVRRWDVPQERKTTILQVEVDPDVWYEPSSLLEVSGVRSLLDGQWLDWILWDAENRGFVETPNQPTTDYYPQRWRKIGAKRWSTRKRRRR